MASSLPVVSAAYLTTLLHVPSRFLEPCPQGHVRRVRRQGLLAPLSSTRWRGSWGSCLQRAEAIDGANGIGAVLRHARGGVLLRRPTLWAVRVRDTCPWTEPPVRRGRGRQHRSTSSAARLGMPTSEGKRSGCALRAVCARRSDWLCASSGQLRHDSFVRLLPAYPVSTPAAVFASLGLPVTTRVRGGALRVAKRQAGGSLPSFRALVGRGPPRTARFDPVSLRHRILRGRLSAEWPLYEPRESRPIGVQSNMFCHRGWVRYDFGNLNDFARVVVSLTHVVRVGRCRSTGCSSGAGSPRPQNSSRALRQSPC